MVISKESLLKLSKEDLVDAIIKISEANERMLQTIDTVMNSIKILHPRINKFEEDFNSIKKEVTNIRKSCESEEKFRDKLREYFKELK